MNDAHRPVSHLSRYRRDAGLSQEKLARLTHVSTSTIQKLEAAATAPYLGTAVRLAAVLSEYLPKPITIGDLFEYEEAAS